MAEGGEEAVPPLTADLTHGQDEEEGGAKFLMVEDEEYRDGEFIQVRRRAYFHQVIEGIQSESQHLLHPPEYHLTNYWEGDAGFQQPYFPVPGDIQYQQVEAQLDHIPHLRNRHNYDNHHDNFEAILSQNDRNWLFDSLKIDIVQGLHLGKSGNYFAGTVNIDGFEKQDYLDDIRRELTAEDNPSVGLPVVVIKTYHTDGMTQPEQMERLYEETLAHIELKHTNIVDTYAVRFLVEKKGELGKDGVINAIDGQTDIHSFVVMEYSPAGSFAMLLMKIQHDQLSFEYYYVYLMDIIAGLLYLHSTGRAHREFNYTNCLAVPCPEDRLPGRWWHFWSPAPANCVIKICDFAYTRRYEEQELLKIWQSMDVMDFARMILWHLKEFFFAQEYEDLRRNLIDLIKYLVRESVDERLENFNRLLMLAEDEGQDVQVFINSTVQSYFQQKSAAGVLPAAPPPFPDKSEDEPD